MRGLEWSARTSLLLVAIVVGWPGAGQADTSVYSVHVGVNSPPADSALQPLSYADDDAARFFRFVEPFARRASLAAVLDATTQRRYPKLAARSLPPSREALERVLLEMEPAMRADRKAGRRVVLYFSYSGHGVPGLGETRLTVLDGVIDRRWLEAHVLSLPADFVHFFLDACHAEGVVRGRGVIKRTARGRTRALSRSEREALLGDDLRRRHPQLGALVAATSSRMAHEWSKLQSGIFTHEVLSALAGAADVNGDGEIAYSEAAAFIAAANRGIDHPDATPAVTSLPPSRDRSSPLLARAWLKRPTLLTGLGRDLGQLHLETEAGHRLLDAHPDPTLAVALLVPAGEPLWVVIGGTREAAVTLRAGERREVRSLSFKPAERPLARGSVASALGRGWFTTPYGRAYYQGWVDSHQELSVSFRSGPSAPPAPAARDPLARPSRGLALPATCLGGAVAALAATITFSVLAVQARNEYSSTDLQRPAEEAWSRHLLHRGLAIGSGVATAALGLATYWLWPRRAAVRFEGVQAGKLAFSW